MTKYRLHYFNARGYAEASRALFHLADVEFEDVRYEFVDWADEKKNIPGFMPFGKMPVLEVIIEEKTQKIPQSFAVARYLAKKFGYAGKTAEEEAMADAFGDLFKDFLSEMKPWGLVAFGYGIEGDREALKQSCLLPARKKFFECMEKSLKDSESGFLISSGITWPDLFIFETFTSILNFEPDFIGSDYPLVAKLFENVSNYPKLKEYYETRPLLLK
ncbi:unnamed protein product [Caenorhabditis angaria]|uniref:glutathione transferase n=1 Tax=Caenorhabditis angaria TaxID=860376 RepID=A0A9P1ITW3_9PELO|nr:unnamed protein product [Caenorhabditis angaria]